MRYRFETNDEYEFRLRLNGAKWFHVCWEFDQWLRTQVKHGEYPTDQYELLEKVREELWEKVSEEGLSFND